MPYEDKRDQATAVKKVIVPSAKTPNGGFAFTWDHRFQSLQVATRCGVNAHGVQAGQFKMQSLFRAMDVRPEELRALADEIEAEQNVEDLTMPELCRKAIDTLDLKGKSVLDIGGYDGQMAAYCLERGAEKAIVLDNEQWREYGWKGKRMPPGVDYYHGDFMNDNIILNINGQWDVVLFFNVIYHCEDPHLALRQLRRITRWWVDGTMLLCTMYIYSDLPVWRVYEPREVNPTDETVYWAPSAAGLHKSLKVCGWSEVEEVGRTVERMVVSCRP